MPLASLIIASDDADQSAFPASLRVAGMTLLEYQVRQARAAGAVHIVVLATRLPQSLIAALDHLARDKIAVDIARTPRDAADRIHPDESLLVIAGGSFATPETIGRVARSAKPVLLTRDAERGAAFERIDGAAHWTGLALLDGMMLRDTASLLGEWALGPTLLRIALQRAIARDHLGANESRAVLSLASDADAAAANSLLAGDHDGPATWADRIYAPIGKRLIPRLLNSDGLVELLSFLPLTLLACALLTALGGYSQSAIGLLLLAHFPAWLAKRADQITGHVAREASWIAPSTRIIASILCASLGWSYFLLTGERSMLSLALIAAVQFHLSPTSDLPVDPTPDMLIILISSLAGFPDLGFLLVILARLALPLWLRYKRGAAVGR